MITPEQRRSIINRAVFMASSEIARAVKLPESDVEGVIREHQGEISKLSASANPETQPRWEPILPVGKLGLSKIADVTLQPTTCRVCGDRFETTTARINLALLRKVKRTPTCPTCTHLAEQRAAKLEEDATALERAQRSQRWITALPRLYRDQTFDTWAPRQGFKAPMETCRTYAEQFPLISGMPEQHPSIALEGPPGVGKSTMLCMIARVVMERAAMAGMMINPVRYTTGYDLVDRILSSYRESYTGPSKDEILADYRSCRLLILDDIGDKSKEPSTDHTRRAYFAIIDSRYANGLPIATASNVSDGALEEFLGPAAYSRLCEMAPKPIRLMGKDWRKKGGLDAR